MLDDTDTAGTITLGLLEMKGETVAIDVSTLAEVAHIENLKPELDQTPGVLGLISIRGTLIPVCDPFSFFNTGEMPGIAAVLIRDRRAIGLGVDRVQGLRRFRQGDIQRMEGSVGRGFGHGTLQLDGKLIEVLDTEALLTKAGLPTAQTSLRKSQSGERNNTRPHLTFEAGGVAFAVPARTIFGTVPRQPIEDTTLADGTYLGTITYFRRRVPVMQTNRVFGLGVESGNQASETVVLRLPNDRLLGFAVDKICHVALPPEKDFRPLTINMDDRMGLLSSMIKLNGAEHFLIDEDRLQRNDGLISAAELSERTDEESEKEAIDAADQLAKASGINQVERLRDRFLIVESGVPVAMRMRDLRGVRKAPQPENITTCAGFVPGLIGICFIDGQLVPLLDLATHLGFPQDTEDDQTKRVLLVQVDDFVARFLVEDIDSVATSVWFSRQDDRVSDRFDLVALRQTDGPKVFNFLDIHSVTADLAAGWKMDPALVEDPS